MISTIYIVLLIGFMQGFVFNLFSVFTKRLKVKAHLYLNLIVFFLSLNNLEAWLNANKIVFNEYYLDHLHTPWYILLAPFLYLFLSEYVGFPKKKIVLNISLSFFIGLSIIKFIFLYNSIGLDPSTLSKQLKLFNQIAEAVGFSITIGMFVYSYKMLKNKANTINKLRIDDLKWLEIFFKISFIILLIWIVVLIIVSFYGLNLYDLLHISVSFLIYWIAYMGTQKQSLFTERLSLRSIEKNNRKEIKKTIINENEISIDEVKDFLLSSEIYTNPLLNVDDIANELGINKIKLSKLINQHAPNFSYYINQFRIEKAKKFLIDKTYKKYTILAIGLEAGFNSKSTFYSVFKEHTEKTPKAWKTANSIEM